LALAACGGGGGDATPQVSTLLSGTAAAGAPIIGTVTIKDSATPTAQTKTVTIAADGKYTVDVSDLTAPYMVRADGFVGGNEYHLYSAGTAADVGGTINITPLTDLIVANIAGSVAQSYFDNGDFSGLTAAELTAQADALKSKLLPVLQALGVSDSIDLLRASFSTDHTGLDAALDILQVSTDPTTQIATITNIITQQQMTSNIATGAYAGAMTETTGVATGVTDIQALSALFNTFSGLFATGVPSETNPTLLSLFDSATFLQGGQNLNSFLSEITSDPTIVGLTFANIAIQSIDVASGTAVVDFDVLFNGQVDNHGPEAFHAIKIGGQWYLQGDQFIAEIDIDTSAEYHPTDSFNQFSSGLNLYISDRGGLGLTDAVVTGPGLPAEGVALVSNIASEHFDLVGQNSGNFYSLSDAAIAAIAETGESYTVTLFIGSEVAATYNMTIGKRPYLVSSLTAANFPAIIAPTAAGLQAYNGGNLTVTWTLPAGLTNDWLNLFINDDVGNSAQAEFALTAAERSKTFTLNPVTSTGQSFTVSGRSIWLAANDSFGRRVATSLF
jgi:hypothetical protein